MNTPRKIAAALAAALTLGTFAIGAAGEAQARDGRNAALFGGLAAGALLGGALVGANRGYAAPAYDYPSYPAYPAYGGVPARYNYGAAPYDSYEAPVVVQQCWRERQPVYDNWGEVVGFRRVRVCN
jgi:hypothetical protein